MRFDATSSALYKSVELPLRSCRWFVNPASDTPDAMSMADFAHDNLWEFGGQSMDDIIRLALQCLPFGFAWLEILYDYIDQGPWSGKVGWYQLAWRSQATLWRWNMDYVGGRRQLVSATQLAPPFYQQIEIPRSKLLIFSNDQEGDNYAGYSLFRPAWKSYIIRDRLYRIQAIGLERAYMGVPVADLPEGYSDDLRDLARSIVESLRTDEQAGVIKPLDLGLEILKGELQGPAMQQAIAHHNRQILLSQLAQFLDLGSGQASGAYALSSDHSELFLNAIAAKGNYIAQVINQEPGLPSLMRFNFPNVDREQLPRLQHGDIGQKALDRLGRALQALGQWGFLTPDDATEDRLRQMLDLPERQTSITDRALFDLIQETFPHDQQWGRQTSGARLQSPLETQAMKAQAPSTEAVPGKGAGPAVDAGPAPAGKGTPSQRAQTQQAAERRYRYAELVAQTTELIARRRWERPEGRVTDRQRMRVAVTEEFADAMEDFHRSAGQKPERPSLRMARTRRPYTIRSATPLAPPAGAAEVAQVHRQRLADALGGRG